MITHKLKTKKLVRAISQLLPKDCHLLCVAGKYLFPKYETSGAVGSSTLCFIYYKPGITDDRATWPRFIWDLSMSLPTTGEVFTFPEDGTRIIDCTFGMYGNYTETTLYCERQIRKLTGNAN